MEALAEDAATLAAEEHRLKRELREVQRESAQKAEELAALHRRREALIAERGDGEQAQSALRTEHGEADVKLERLRRQLGAQRIAKAWHRRACGALVGRPRPAPSGTPVKWRTPTEPPPECSSIATVLGSTRPTRLRLLEKLWARLDSAQPVDDGAIREAVTQLGYEEPSLTELELVRGALAKDLGRQRWASEQLSRSLHTLSTAALADGTGSLHSPAPLSPFAAPRRGLGGPRRRSSRSSGGLSAGTIYASIVPALSQLKARQGQSLAPQIAGAKALAQAALDPQARAAIHRADGKRLLEEAVAVGDEAVAAARAGNRLLSMLEGGEGEGHAALGLELKQLRLDVDIALERLGEAAASPG